MCKISNQMTLSQQKNNAITKITSTNGNVIVVENGTVFSGITTPFTATKYRPLLYSLSQDPKFEILHIESISGNTLTVLRGQEGTALTEITESDEGEFYLVASPTADYFNNVADKRLENLPTDLTDQAKTVIRQKIGVTDTDTSGLETRITALETAVGTNTQNITDLTARVTITPQQAQQIVTNTNELGNINAVVSGDTLTITLPDGTERTFTVTSGGEAGATAEQVAQIQANLRAISTNTSSITALQTRVTALENRTIPTPLTNEDIFNIVKDFFEEGDNITITPNDTANTLTISATGRTNGGDVPADGNTTYTFAYNPSTQIITITASDGTPITPINLSALQTATQVSSAIQTAIDNLNIPTRNNAVVVVADGNERANLTQADVRNGGFVIQGNGTGQERFRVTFTENGGINYTPYETNELVAISETPIKVNRMQSIEFNGHLYTARQAITGVTTSTDFTNTSLWWSSTRPTDTSNLIADVEVDTEAVLEVKTQRQVERNETGDQFNLRTILTRYFASSNVLDIFAPIMPLLQNIATFFRGSARVVETENSITTTDGYSLGVDFRDVSESVTPNENRYIDNSLTASVNNAFFEITGFGTSVNRLITLQIERGTVATEEPLLTIGAEHELVRVNSNYNIEINTSATAEAWVTIDDGFGGHVTLPQSGVLTLTLQLERISDTVIRIVPVDSVGDTVTAFNDREVMVNFSTNTNNTLDRMQFGRVTGVAGVLTGFKVAVGTVLTHAQIRAYLTNHLTDKWVFGLFRLETNTTEHFNIEEKVNFTSGLQVSGEDVAKVSDIPKSTGGGLPAGFVSYDAMNTIKWGVNSAGTTTTAVDAWNNLTREQQNSYRLFLEIQESSIADYIHAPSVAELQALRGSGTSIVLGFRVPAPNVAGGRLTVNFDSSTGKLTTMTWESSSGGTLQTVEFVRIAGIYYEPSQ